MSSFADIWPHVFAIRETNIQLLLLEYESNKWSSTVEAKAVVPIAVSSPIWHARISDYDQPQDDVITHQHFFWIKYLWSLVRVSQWTPSINLFKLLFVKLRTLINYTRMQNSLWITRNDFWKINRICIYFWKEPNALEADGQKTNYMYLYFQCYITECVFNVQI